MDPLGSLTCTPLVVLKYLCEEPKLWLSLHIVLDFEILKFVGQPPLNTLPIICTCRIDIDIHTWKEYKLLWVKIVTDLLYFVYF